MNIFKTLRKPYLTILMSSLILFVSCNQYDQISETNNILDKQTIANLEKATIDFINDVKNNPEKFSKTSEVNYSGMGDKLVNQALTNCISNNLELYQQNVTDFAVWNNDQLAAIEAIFIVLNVIKKNFSQADAAKFNKSLGNDVFNKDGAWWAPLAFWGVCTVVGVLTVGIAGIACAGLVAARVSYLNYQNQ